MPDWWSYSLSDFLLFSPRTYYRLIERHNLAVWPAQIVTLALGLVLLVLVRRQTPAQGRIISSILALLWAWVAWAFVWNRYATINWAVVYLIPLFALQVLLLVWFGVVRNQLSFQPSRDTAGIAGMTLLVFSLAAHPALGAILGRTWRQAEVFGIAPDPTVIGTAGLTLLIVGRARWELLAVPLLWCLVSGLTLLAMDSPEAFVPPVVALTILIAAGSRRLSRSPKRSLKSAKQWSA